MTRLSMVLCLLGLAAGTLAGCAGRDGRVSGVDKTTVDGSNGMRLTLVKPRNVTIERGSAESVGVDVERDNFDGEVTIQFTRLPAGVEAVDSPRRTRGNHEEVVLRASHDADLVRNHQALVTVEGPDGMRATESIEISINQRS